MIRSVNGKTPRIAEGVFIAETAAIIGDVEIGRGSSVWYGAVIRGDVAPIRIGENTNIQDCCVLHCNPDAALRIGNNVTVGHGAVVHCAEVGDNVLIGMGATLLGGAVIGDCAVIGAGAVVKENGRISAGSLAVGVPAKIVRKLTPAQLEQRKAPSEYIKLAEQYRDANTGYN